MSAAAPVKQTRPGLAHVTRTTIAKDMRLEWRSKDAVNGMLFFALLVVVIFSFSFDPSAEEARTMAGGLIWTAFLFAALVALNQTWARELRNQVLDAYRVSPAPPNALFLGKAVANFLFIALVEALVVPAFILFPISLPAVIAMVVATTAVLVGESPKMGLTLLGVYDVVFTTVCLLLFETVLHAE